MATHLEITQAQYEALIEQAQSAYPLETCGLMGGASSRVRRLYPVDNILRSPVAYEMDPTGQLRAMLDMEKKGWELLAIYHSHPHGPQTPSATDVDQAYYPDSAYVIISLRSQPRPEIRAFNIVAGRVEEIPLHVV